jgi:integrase/recombinase XerD
MTDKIIVYDTERALAASLNKIRNSSELCDENKMAILEFQNQCFSEGLSEVRIVKYMSTLCQIGITLGQDFRSVKRDDIFNLVRKIETNKSYADWTKHDYKVALKRFFRWLRGGEDYPEEVKWIKTTVKNGNHKLPEEMLTEEEIQKIIGCSEHPRDKAFVSVLYESGCRIGELLTLRLKHIHPDRYGAKIIVSGKTGMRSVRLIASAPYLTLWANIHPDKDNPEAPVWLELRKKTDSERSGIDHKNASILLKRLARRAGIRKRIYPHLFRHSRATHLAKQLTEAQMKEHFGWTQGSEMAGIYVHLSGRDVDDALLKVYGMKKEEPGEASVLKPKICPRCGQTNPADGKFCSKCGQVVDVRTAADLDKRIRQSIPIVDTIKVLLSNEAVQKVLRKDQDLINQIRETIERDSH